MAATVSNGNGTDVVSLLKKTKPPALKKLASWKDENEFDDTGNPKTPRTSTTPGKMPGTVTTIHTLINKYYTNYINMLL